MIRRASRWAQRTSRASAPTRRDDDAARCDRGKGWGELFGIMAQTPQAEARDERHGLGIDALSSLP